MAIRDLPMVAWRQLARIFHRLSAAARTPTGYSLIELLAGLSLVALLAGTSVPVFSRLIQAYNLRGATLEIFAQLHEARMAAVSQGTRYRMKLADTGKLIVSRYDVATASWIDDSSVPPLPSRSPNVVVAASGEIIFASNGTAPSAATITLTNPAGSQRRIVVSLGGSVRAQ